MRRRLVAGRGGEQLREAAACSLSLRGMHDAVPSLCDTARTWGSSSKGGGGVQEQVVVQVSCWQQRSTGCGAGSCCC